MRGKAVDVLMTYADGRITPAYAGKSCRFHFQSSASWDHPRLCGEKGDSTSGYNPKSGSPPPMRGKDRLCSERSQKRGITPAYAGKSGLDEEEG